MALYLDTSALVKLIFTEMESDHLREFVGTRELVSSQLARTELVRTVARHRPRSLDGAECLLGAMTLIALSHQLTARASWVKPAELRSLDAIHVASAMAMQEDLEALVTYHGRMIDAGRIAGLPVASPGRGPA